MKNPKKSNLLEKFADSQIEHDLALVGGASDIMTHLETATYVGKGGDLRHYCDTTLNDDVVVGYTFPKDD